MVTHEYDLFCDETHDLSALGMYNPVSYRLPSNSNYHELCISLGYWDVPDVLESLVTKCPKDGYITVLLPNAAGREWVEGTKGWINHGEFIVSMQDLQAHGDVLPYAMVPTVWQDNSAEPSVVLQAWRFSEEQAGCRPTSLYGQSSTSSETFLHSLIIDSDASDPVVQLPDLSSTCIVFEGMVQGKSCRVLLDSGASGNFISQSFWLLILILSLRLCTPC